MCVCVCVRGATHTLVHTDVQTLMTQCGVLHLLHMMCMCFVDGCQSRTAALEVDVKAEVVVVISTAGSRGTRDQRKLGRAGFSNVDF